MIDMPLAQSGAIVSVATANDEDHPASNIIDGRKETFWMTTGLYPQSVTITFPQTRILKSLHLSGFGIQNLAIERSVRSHPVEFELIDEKVMKKDERRMQASDLQFSKGLEARHIKIIIIDGYDSFAAIQNINANFEK